MLTHIFLKGLELRIRYEVSESLIFAPSASVTFRNVYHIHRLA
jgi:hypothetical protein